MEVKQSSIFLAHSEITQRQVNEAINEDPISHVDPPPSLPPLSQRVSQGDVCVCPDHRTSSRLDGPAV